MKKQILSIILLVLVLIVMLMFTMVGRGDRNRNETQPTEEKKESYSMTTGSNRGQHSSAQSSFTNKYGTSTTKCAHTGCSNYIANSGDTNCCKEHSNRCLDCNKYIDEDAYYCISCIAAAATPSCEACSKDATYSIKGLTGQTEYYCTEHYNDMKDLWEWLENN
jgi:hypothetical protein